MVAGVIVVAVAVRLTIEAPGASAPAEVTATLLGGPAIYLGGLVLFKRSVGRGKLGPPLMAIVALALLVLLALFADRLVLACAVAAVLAALALSAGRAVGEDAPAAQP
jgi:low temperature requirement protein LtrA